MHFETGAMRRAHAAVSPGFIVHPVEPVSHAGKEPNTRYDRSGKLSEMRAAEPRKRRVDVRA